MRRYTPNIPHCMYVKVSREGSDRIRPWRSRPFFPCAPARKGSPFVQPRGGAARALRDAALELGLDLLLARGCSADRASSGQRQI